MFLINTFDLAAQDALPGLHNIVRRNGALELHHCAEVGEILTPPLSPLMAYAFDGFELRPEEESIEVAVLKRGVPYQWNGTSWTVASELVYTSPQLIRQHLPRWHGPIQFRLRLHRRCDDASPRVQEIKVGYTVSGEMLEYAFKFALPKLLSVPVTLHRWAQPDATGTALPVPPGIDCSRIGNITVFQPEQLPQPGTLDRSSHPPAIRVETPLTVGQATRLVIEVEPLIDTAGGELYQIADVPMLLLRLQDRENVRRLVAEDSIRLANGKTRVATTHLEYDQQVEVITIAYSGEESRSLCDAIVSRVKKLGYLYLPPFDLNLPIVVKGGSALRSTQGDLSRGDLSSRTVDLVLLKLTSGDTIDDLDTLYCITDDIAPVPLPPVSDDPKLLPVFPQAYMLPDVADEYYDERFIVGGVWAPPEQGEPLYYEIEFRREGESWTSPSPNRTRGLEFETRKRPTGTYYVRVRATFETVQSVWIESEPITIDPVEGHWNYLAGII